MILHNATVDTILERRSVRSYAPQQITPDELETILEAGRSAPSGMNQQSAIAVAVQSKAELAQLVELAKAAAHQDHNPVLRCTYCDSGICQDDQSGTHGGRLYGRSRTCFLPRNHWASVPAGSMPSMLCLLLMPVWRGRMHMVSEKSTPLSVRWRQGIPPEQNLSQRNTMHFINAFNT